MKVFKSPAHPRRGYSANNVAAATPLSLPPESLPSFCYDNFTVTMLNKATLQDQPGMWSQGSWHCTKTEQLIGFLLLLSSLQFLAWIFLSYFTIFLDNHIYRGGPSCVKVSFTRKTDFFQTNEICPTHMGQSFRLSEMRNMYWSHGIAEDSSNHLDPRLSTLLIWWFTFQVKKKLVLPKAKAGCSSGDSLLQELLLAARGLVPSKPPSTCSHVGIQLIPSVSYKNTNLKHFFHTSGILHWKNHKWKYIFIYTHVHTHTYVLGSHICHWCLYALSSCYKEIAPKECEGVDSIYTV